MVFNLGFLSTIFIFLCFELSSFKLEKSEFVLMLALILEKLSLLFLLKFSSTLLKGLLSMMTDFSFSIKRLLLKRKFIN